MGKKGEETKNTIRTKACELFAQKGFKEVTMKDICEATGLSRGGLYRHYESTEQIFLDITASFLTEQNYEFKKKISQHVPAGQILEEILEKYRQEMLDNEQSLSLAIYEFFSSRKEQNNDNLLWQQYRASYESWKELIHYGIDRGEFKKVNPKKIFDMIVFSYQGVRMYSRLMELSTETPENITDLIKDLLLQEERANFFRSYRTE